MPGLTLQTTDAVIVAELDRPPQNLFSIELCDQLTAVLDDPPPGAHILRFRSTGDAFCLGRDRGGSTPSDVRAEAEFHGPRPSETDLTSAPSRASRRSR